MEKRPVIIDCDPGIDDALAMILLGGCGVFDIVGVTAVHGNAGLDHTRRNATYMRDLLRWRCPVVSGADKAILARHPRAQEIHGGNGFAGVSSGREDAWNDGEYAWDFIAGAATSLNGELELIAVGPLTNIALAVLKYPELASQIKRVTVMGGGATAGNVTATAEFNAHQDPHAAEIVFKAGFRDLVVVDLDACESAALTAAEADRMLDLESTNPLAPLLKTFRAHTRTVYTKYMDDGPVKKHYESRYIPCDAVAAAVAAWPDLARYAPVAASCECAGAAVGQTIFDRRQWIEPNAKLACNVSRDDFVRLFYYGIHQFDGEVLE